MVWLLLSILVIHYIIDGIKAKMNDDNNMRLIKRVLLIGYLAIVAYFVQPAQSHADEINIQTELESKTDQPVDILADSTVNAQARSSASLSNSAAIQTKVNTAVIYQSGALKNPYSLLVGLALQGKSAEGAKSYNEAAAIYCKAARDGDANAQFALGWMYANGRGVRKDENLAAYLYKKSAAQGHSSASKELTNSSQSAGNSALAIMPSCMLPDPPVKVVNNNHTVNLQDIDVTTPQVAFYAKGPIFKIVSRLSPKFQIDTDLVMAFISVESGFNTQATSAKNAQGLMQLIPDTAKRFRVKDAYNPEDNIKGGMAYLQWLLAYFQGDIELVAAAYNSGELTVEKYNGVPPYTETRNYVKRISSLYKKSFHPYKENLVDASPMIIKLQQRYSEKNNKIGM